jgi:hypothetical protein
MGPEALLTFRIFARGLHCANLRVIDGLLVVGWMVHWMLEFGAFNL